MQFIYIDLFFYQSLLSFPTSYPFVTVINSPHQVHIKPAYAVATGPGVEGSVVKRETPLRITAFNGDGQQTKTGGDHFVVEVQVRVSSCFISQFSVSYIKKKQ